MDDTLKNKNERGNIIFYILIAIVLLAGLTYAVTNNSRVSSSSLTGEQARIAAQEIIDYGNSLATAVQKLTLRGCSDTEISFENGIVAGYSNVNAPTNEACHIFSGNGGRINSIEFDAGLDQTFNARSFYGEIYVPEGACVEGWGSDQSYCVTNGDDDEDLVIILSWVQKEVCMEINELLNIENQADDPPEDSGRLWSNPIAQFTGSYVDTSYSIDSRASNAATIYGQASACLKADTGGSQPGDGYHFYQGLIAR